MGFLPLRGDFRLVELHDAEIFFRSDFLKSHLKHRKTRKNITGCFHHSGLMKYFFEKKILHLLTGPTVRPTRRASRLPGGTVLQTPTNMFEVTKR